MEKLKLEKRESMAIVIQDLAFFNKMVNLKGQGAGGIKPETNYPVIRIDSPQLPQWAFDLLRDKVLIAVEEAKIEIDRIANKKYMDAFLKVKKYEL